MHCDRPWPLWYLVPLNVFVWHCPQNNVLFLDRGGNSLTRVVFIVNSPYWFRTNNNKPTNKQNKQTTRKWYDAAVIENSDHWSRTAKGSNPLCCPRELSFARVTQFRTHSRRHEANERLDRRWHNKSISSRGRHILAKRISPHLAGNRDREALEEKAQPFRCSAHFPRELVFNARPWSRDAAFNKLLFLLPRSLH